MDLLTASTRHFPENEAVVQGHRRLTYRLLKAASDGLAGRLVDQGVTPGARVVLFLENSAEYVLSFCAVLRAGGVVVPINSQQKVRGVEKVLADCTPVLILSEKKLCLRLPATDIPVLRLESGSVEAYAVQPRPAQVFPTRGEDDLCMLIYTSGTTGEPKGVMLTHRNVESNARSIIEYLELGSGDRVLAVLPFSYSYGNSLLTTHLLCGGTLVTPQVNFAFPNKILDMLVEERATGFAGVGSTYALLLRHSNLRNYRFPDLRYVTQAGSALAPALAQELAAALPGTAIYLMYGQTEATARLSYLPPADYARKPGSIGKAIPGVTLEVVEGELVARGPNIMQGYWGQPEQTAQVLRPDGLHTGDLARMDEEGYFYVVGRASDMIKSGAHRISPGEIEEVLLEMPGVLDAAAAGYPDEILGEAVGAFVVPADPDSLTQQDVLSHCHRHLPLFKMPKKVTFLETLPRTVSGKLKRHALCGGE